MRALCVITKARRYYSCSLDFSSEPRNSRRRPFYHYSSYARLSEPPAVVKLDVYENDIKLPLPRYAKFNLRLRRSVIGKLSFRSTIETRK